MDVEHVLSAVMHQSHYNSSSGSILPDIMEIN